MNRLIILLFTLLLSVSAWARGKYSIIQGTTSGSVTHFTVVAPKNHALNFEIIDVAKKSYRISEVTETGMDGSEWTVRRIRVEELDAKTEYVLLVKDSADKLEEARSFALLDSRKKIGKIGLASCMMRFLNNSLLWENMRNEINRPDLFLFLGDAVYLDRIDPLVGRNPESPLEAWEEFVATRNTVDFYFWDHLIPVFSVWDDHDSGGDGATSKTYPLMREVHKIYDTFFPNVAIDGAVERGPGLSLNFKLFGQNIIMLDGRSFRDENLLSPVLGVDQETWMLEKLKPGSNMLVSGSQFFGKYLQKDSYEFVYPEAFANFTSRLNRVAESKNALLTFVSGDIHFSEIQAIEPEFFGYPTYEITSSPAHSSTVPGRHKLTPFNPRRIEAVSTHNILNLEMDHSPGEFSANVKSIGWRGNVLFERHVRTVPAQRFMLRAQNCRKALAI